MNEPVKPEKLGVEYRIELSMRVVARRAPVTYEFLPGRPIPLVDTMPGMPKAPMALPKL